MLSRPVACALTETTARAATAPFLTDYSILGHVTVNDATAPAVDSPPVNGFVPQVVMGMTNQDDPNNLLFATDEATITAGAVPQDDVGSNRQWLPSTAGVKYTVATFDTGSQSYIVGFNDVNTFGLTDDFQSGNSSEIAGASGTEEADITIPLGVYFAGLNQASVNAGAVTATGTMTGQFNAAVLTASSPASVLPNIVGALVLAQYQVSIFNSQPQSVTVGGTTYRSPKVTFTSLSTNPPLPSNYYRLTLDLQSPAGVSSTASYIPDLDGLGGLSQPVNAKTTGGAVTNIGGSFSFTPTTPTFWMSMFASVGGTQGGNAIASQPFLFDSGSQVTVLSEDTAAQFGFFTGGPNPSTPAFTVDVAGVGGTTTVPGFYVDQLKVLTNGGYITWNHVPVLVIDLPDARDGVGFMPGVLGMNLFSDRDLVINGGIDNPAVSFSEQMQWYVNGSGLWSESAKWMLGTPNSVDRPAQFLGKITSPQTITVDASYTVGSLVFDNANRYTLAGPGMLTLQTSDGMGDAGINVFSGSHTINAPLTLANSTTIDIAQASSILTITSDVTAPNIPITKVGDGTVQMKNVRTGSLALNGGTVQIAASGASTATSVLNSITAAGGKMDLQNNKLIVKGAAGGGSATLGAWNGSAYDGITGLVAAGRNGGGWNGSGIVTSQTNASSSKFLTTLAVATADQIGRVGQNFGGQIVGAGDVLVMYTYAGDADLSGSINGDDYFRIDNSM